MAQSSGFYAGANIGYSHTDVQDVTASDITDLLGAGYTASNVRNDRSDTSWKVFSGYTINSNFAVELGYARVGKAKSSATISDGVNSARISVDAKVDAIFLDLVGTVPFSADFAGHARLGVASTDTKVTGRATDGIVSVSDSDSDRGTSLKFGLGLSYKLSTSMSLVGEWERYRVDAFDDKTNVDNYSVGIIYRF